MQQNSAHRIRNKIIRLANEQYNVASLLVLNISLKINNKNETRCLIVSTLYDGF